MIRLACEGRNVILEPDAFLLNPLAVAPQHCPSKVNRRLVVTWPSRFRLANGTRKTRYRPVNPGSTGVG
jgi:hypothetical protein